VIPNLPRVFLRWKKKLPRAEVWVREDVFPGPVWLGGPVSPSPRTGASKHSGGDLLVEPEQEGLCLPSQ
jgi:hypothetical protein